VDIANTALEGAGIETFASGDDLEEKLLT